MCLLVHSGHSEEGWHELGERRDEGFYDNGGENVPGDSEIVEMLIVHFQSSIKFNNHSASTCYSNSVTESTSGMFS